MKTSEKLKTLRTNAKLSRKELAEISGFKERTILAFEMDEREPNYKYLEFCALYFGYELDSITTEFDYSTKANLNAEHSLNDYIYNEVKLKKMNQAEQILRIYSVINGLSKAEFYEFLTGENATNDEASGFYIKALFNDYPHFADLAIQRLNINQNDYTPTKYAEFIKLQSITKKQVKRELSAQDLEILALFSMLNDETKESIKELIKTISKGAEMK